MTRRSLEPPRSPPGPLSGVLYRARVAYNAARSMLERPGLAQARPRRTLGSERPAV
jgi:hypothetical protein